MRSVGVAGVPLAEWFGRIGCSRGQLPDRNNHHGEWLPDSEVVLNNPHNSGMPGTANSPKPASISSKWIAKFHVSNGSWHESYGEATLGRHQASDEVTSRRFGALINCMGMAPRIIGIVLHRQSPVVATTIYRHNPDSLGEHLIQNAYCALLMGSCTTVIGTFWTEHPHARVMPCLRLLSGGPVYCSDACGHTDAAVLRDLLAEDGTLPRPDEPARPVIASLLNDPEHTDYALGVARFGAEQVIAFVGLRRQPQIGITASGRSCRIIDDHGATIDMNPGETHAVSTAMRVFRVQS